MEIIKSTSNIDFGVIIKLSEIEVKALLALTAYGTKEFLNTFYKYMGESQLKPNEAGLSELFKTIKNELPKHIDKFDKVRAIWSENNLKN